MADAAVEEPPRPSRFYCHICEVEFQHATANYTCPHCSDGFIEELQDAEPNTSQSNNSQSFDDFSMWDDEEMDSDPPAANRRRGTLRPRRLTRLASSNLRQQIPVENLIQDFIINLGVGVNWGGMGNVQLFLGNPGDYAWGREGLDAIVTQLLNQMDNAGPPPLSKQTIDSLPLVEVSEDQVASNLQCSVCWDHFETKESVRQLPCQHIYHENCIRPWLELHGTCPICRQNLSQGSNDGVPPEDTNNSQDPLVLEATGHAASVQNVLRSLFGGSPSASNAASSSSNSMDQSDTSRSNSDSTL